MDQIHKLPAEGCRYSNEKFEKAGELLKKKELESDKPKISEEIFAEITLILDEMNEVKTEVDPEKSIQQLRNLKERCNKLIDGGLTLKEKDKGTGVLAALVANVEINKNKILDAICYNAENKEKIDEEECRAMLENVELEQYLRLMKQASTSKGKAIGTAVTAGIALASTVVAAATAITAFNSALTAGEFGLGATTVASTILAPAAIVLAPFTLLSAFAINRLTTKKVKVFHDNCFWFAILRLYIPTWFRP